MAPDTGRHCDLVGHHRHAVQMRAATASPPRQGSPCTTWYGTFCSTRCKREFGAKREEEIRERRNLFAYIARRRRFRLTLSNPGGRNFREEEPFGDITSNRTLRCFQSSSPEHALNIANNILSAGIERCGRSMCKVHVRMYAEGSSPCDCSSP